MFQRAIKMTEHVAILSILMASSAAMHIAASRDERKRRNDTLSR